MSKKKDDVNKLRTAKSSIKLIIEIDPTECPFREFKDNELQFEFWGMGPAAVRIYSGITKGGLPKPAADYVWVDEQTQPLPRSARHFLNRWIRAEDLAQRRWNCDVVVFEENNEGNDMSVADYQLSHTQVLLRSSFCRRVLSACYMLERAGLITAEHQWDNFVFSFPPEGWRAKCHIYSPGMKSGGGLQHRPGLSKCGCYLVRLYYLGAWRCVWVNDQVPVDSSEAPLLPFSPLTNKEKPGKQTSNIVSSNVVYLWPLLICKALLKLAAPDMNSDENQDGAEDELMPEFNIMHCLTGGINLTYHIDDIEELWNMITSHVPLFQWDEEEESHGVAAAKTKSTKKPAAKEPPTMRDSMVYITIKDTKDYPPYHLPGITPGFEMKVIITQARDLPLKKPLPEPVVALWKQYRWIDWARRHGLYDDYDCPRTRYLKVNGLMKLSYAPHLLDVQSTESITLGFIEVHKSLMGPDKFPTKVDFTQAAKMFQDIKEGLREWLLFIPVKQLIKSLNLVHYPSMYQYTSAGNNPPLRITKSTHKMFDIVAPKLSPLYFQIDGPDTNILKISLNVLSPRVLMNAGVLDCDDIEPAYVFVEPFEWFTDTEVPRVKGYVETTGCGVVELKFPPGRHICRIWVHSRLNWHLALLSQSTILLGTRDRIMNATIKECPWTSKFLSGLGTAFNSWVKFVQARSSTNETFEKDFFKSYLPDLPWNEEVVGYKRADLHWMIRQALQSILAKTLSASEYRTVCNVLRKYFYDPNFGMKKPVPQRSAREVADLDPCDCIELEEVEEQSGNMEEKITVPTDLLDQLLDLPKPPNTSQICELASTEVPCEMLKKERENLIRKHEAATIIQAYWRGTWARKCLNIGNMPPDVLKLINESACGSLEALSCFMNEFFHMYPGAKSAYSISSAIRGPYDLQQYNGNTTFTANCKWIPYFQGVFYCHANVKVHFDVMSSIQYSTLIVYDNDTGKHMPQVYNAHITFNFRPNFYGYTLIGYGTNHTKGGTHNQEARWQLNVLSSLDNAFHVCDNNNMESCRELTLPQATKFRINEMFIPNIRNILGCIQISVLRQEAVSFRATATSPDLEMVATLSAVNTNGKMEILSTCSGKGVLFWPYIMLHPSTSKPDSISSVNMPTHAISLLSSRSLTKSRSAKTGSARARSKLKLAQLLSSEPKVYKIEVTAPMGWPLNIEQWKRVDEVRNTHIDMMKIDPKKTTKEKGQTTPATSKGSSTKDQSSPQSTHPPSNPIHPGDAYIELECSLSVGGGGTAKRDDERDIQFAAARKRWDADEPGRNLRGSQIRKEFREEFLEISPPLQSETSHSALVDSSIEEANLEEEEKTKPVSSVQVQGPSLATDSGLLETTVDDEEESRYLLKPDQLRDKFVPLYFVPLCTKRKTEEPFTLSPEMAEVAKIDRHYKYEAAKIRFKELEEYNEVHVLGRQKMRWELLEKLFVDSTWRPELQAVLKQREEAITTEALNRNISATKKKQESKKGK